MNSIFNLIMTCIKILVFILETNDNAIHDKTWVISSHLLSAFRKCQCRDACRNVCTVIHDGILNSHGSELHRPLIEGTKLMLKVIKAIIIICGE